MENKNTIYNDDVERVVNNAQKERRNNRMAKVQKKRKKMMANAITFFSIGLIFALFGIAGWLVKWIAFFLFFVFTMYATFCFGRFFENGKCWGWR